jgi:cysteine-rich repeat protein
MQIVCSADLSDKSTKPCDFGCDSGSCVLPSCGDGKVQAGELCDDGNQDPADGCTNACAWGPKQLVLGDHSSCAIFGNGHTKCWGANNYGQLGLGDTKNRGEAPGQMGDRLPFIHLNGKAAAFSSLDIREFACGVSDRKVWCWGDNTDGQIGLGYASEDPVLVPKEVDVGGPARSVTVGFHFACALLETGDVKCWGSNRYGMLGVGLAGDQHIGDQNGEMGSNLRRVDLKESATSVDAGFQHVCALLRSDSVKCWGNGVSGELGTGSASAYGDDSNETEPSIAKLGDGAVVQQIALGSFHACALMAIGIKCWGDNLRGQLGYDNQENVGDDINKLGSALRLVPVTTPSDPVVQLGLLGAGTCTLLRSGSLKCWGYAGAPNDGQLAQPALVAAIGNVGDAMGELSQLSAIDLGPNVTVRSFAGGQMHACALVDTGVIQCWGFNHVGQLGLGHTRNIGDAPEELGAQMKATHVL